MIDKMNGPELFKQAVSEQDSVFEDGDVTDTGKIIGLLSAQVAATNAQTAAIVMLVENHGQYPPYEMDAWREVIPRPPLKECRGKDIRRPECADRHTEDCVYVDPAPEPKHVLLAIGTRVLVSPLHSPDCTCASTQPYVGRIAGYDMSCSKYQINEECYGRPGTYYDFVEWEFATNRVEVHPDGPECPHTPEPVKREPTGPRMYVQNRQGKQGHVVEVSTMNGVLMFQVQWYMPGAEPVWKSADSLTIIPANQVERCPNGQTGDECGSGENQCELCLQAEDAEGDAIEESMGLR